MKNTAVLLVQCPERKGLDATIAEFIYRYDGNILHFEQHQAGDERYFLARVEWDLAGFRLDMKDFDGAFGPIAHKFGMNWCIAPRITVRAWPFSSQNSITASSISSIANEAENSRAIFR